MPQIIINVPDSVTVKKDGADHLLTAIDLIDGYARRGQVWSEDRELPVTRFEATLIENWDGPGAAHESYVAKEGVVPAGENSVQITVGTWKPNALEYARLRLETAIRSEALEGVMLKWQNEEQQRRKKDQRDSLMALGAVGNVEMPGK